MAPACASWCTKWWICSWSYRLSTSSSTMIIFSLLPVRLVCRCCASVGEIFQKFIFHKVLATRFACSWIFNNSFIALSGIPESLQWKNCENSLKIDKAIDRACCTTFSDTVYILQLFTRCVLHCAAEARRAYILDGAISVRHITSIYTQR